MVDQAGKIVITGVDCQTPVGRDIRASAAAIRAGTGLFIEHPFYFPILRDAEEDEPYQATASICTHLTDEEFATERLSELLLEPLIRLVEGSGFNRKEIGDGSICFALPEKGSGIAELNLGQDFLNDIVRKVALPKSVDLTAIKMGSMGFFYFLKKAIEKLESGQSKYVIIAATDSFISNARLTYYDEHWRLKSNRNPHGFIPGEASSLVMLELEEQAKARGANLLARLDGYGIGREPNPVTQDKSSTGEGMTVAFRKCLVQRNNDSTVKWIISGINGEQYHSYEWGVVNSRLLGKISSDVQLHHYADTIGEVGSALPGISIGCAVNAFERGYAVDASALICAGDDKGLRAVLSVSKPEEN